MQGALEVGTKEIGDPYGLTPGARLLATVHYGEDAAEWLYVKGLLTQVRYQVSMRFRELSEAATLGDARAIDYARPKVDGGYPQDPMTDRLIQAGREMAEITVLLGQERISFLRVLLCAGASFAEVAGNYASAYGLDTRGARGFVRGKMAEALDVLGQHWGMLEAAGRKLDRRRVYASIGEGIVPGVIDYDEEIEVRDMRQEDA